MTTEEHQTSMSFPWPYRLYKKFIMSFGQLAKLLTTLTHHDAKFNWTSEYQAAFVSLKGALIKAPILHYPDPLKQ